MAKMQKSDWNPCEVLFKKKLSGNVVSTTDVRSSKNSVNTKIVDSGISAAGERMKTLTQVTSSRQIEKVRADVKSRLPKLTAGEVRRFRIPHWEAVILELQEGGFPESAHYMQRIFKLDEEIRAEAGRGSVLSSKPRLREDETMLERFCNGLRTAEKANKSENFVAQTAAFLETAIFFESQSWEWHWIAKQLYASSLEKASEICDDQHEILTTVKYLYGRFVFDKLNDPKEALKYLNEVRTLSEGKTWNASRIVGSKEETIFRETCGLLHEVLLSLARRVREDDPQLAVQAASQALERAKESFREDAIAGALYELGKLQLAVDEVEKALKSLSKYLAIVKRIPDPEGITNAHLELAFAYKRLEDSDGAVKNLGLLRKCAEQYNLPYKLAQAHYYTGEYLLNKNQATLATPHLELALEKFHSLGKKAEADRSRCAAGISKGQEVMEIYTNLISKCQKSDGVEMAKICKWKNSRIPFWESSIVEEKSTSERSLGESNDLENQENLQSTSGFSTPSHLSIHGPSD